MSLECLLVFCLLPLSTALPVVHATTGDDYSDSLARTQMLKMSAASYAKDPTPCINNTWPNNGGKLQRMITVHCDVSEKDKCTAFSAVSTKDKAIILAFRGTDNNVQLILESVEAIFTWHVSRWEDRLMDIVDTMGCRRESECVLQ